MTKVGDERIAFYLENRRQIDEWAKLNADAANAVYAVFRQLGDQIEAVASGLDGTPTVAFFDDSFPEYQLFERAWPAAEPGQRVPVGVTLGMNRNGVVSGKQVPRIYVGVRVEASYPGNDDLRVALSAALTGNPLCGEKAMGAWPCWQWTSMPTEHWWEDREAFEQTLITALVNAWDQSASEIRRALEQIRPS